MNINDRIQRVNLGGHAQRGRKVVKSGGAKNPGGEASVHVP